MKTFFEEIIMQKKFAHNLDNKLKTSILYFLALSQVSDDHNYFHIYIDIWTLGYLCVWLFS